MEDLPVFNIHEPHIFIFKGYNGELSQGPKGWHRLEIVFLFLYLFYIERQIVERKANSVKRGNAADTQVGPPRMHQD